MVVIRAEDGDLTVIEKGAISALNTTNAGQHEGGVPDMSSSTMRAAGVVYEELEGNVPIAIRVRV
jgi:hypothetical protein